VASKTATKESCRAAIWHRGNSPIFFKSWKTP